MTGFTVAAKPTNSPLWKGYRSLEGAEAAIARSGRGDLAAFGTAVDYDRRAGYEVCMFCVETGPEGHASGAHDVMWDRYLGSLVDAGDEAAHAHLTGRAVPAPAPAPAERCVLCTEVCREDQEIAEFCDPAYLVDHRYDEAEMAGKAGLVHGQCGLDAGWVMS